MATLFEAWLVGDDEEHLTAVGEAALDEIERIEQVLSRFDRQAELFRVNRQAATGPVRLSYELYDVLADCVRHHAETAGFFDITATSDPTLAVSRSERFQLDPANRTVTFTDPRVQLDLGGYGKGYALDAAAKILDRFGITSYLLHGGTSSLLARGSMAHGKPWFVALGDPFDAERRELAKFPLVDVGLSTSAAWDARHVAADIVDPLAQIMVTAAEAYCVTALMAAEAEMLSTALTAMGRVRAEEYLARRGDLAKRGVTILFVERTTGGSRVQQLGEGSQ